MNKESNMVIYKQNNIFGKIKMFFKRFFTRRNKEEISRTNNYNSSKEENFRKNILVEEDEERKRILKIQEEYRIGLIDEDEISKEDYKKLLNLYDEQNEAIRQKIERDKIEIKMMIENLKKA